VLRPSTAAAWALLLLLVIGSVAAVLTWDHTEIPTSGDETSYALQTLSLAYDGHNLSYDDLDTQRWEEVGFRWMQRPQSFFFRTNSEAYTSAKPYGYPLYLAPFVRAFGFSQGLAVGNSLLLLGLVATAVAVLRTRLSGPAVPLLVAAFTFGGALYLYAYAISVELFFALLSGLVTLGALRWWRTRAWPWAVLCFVVVGFAAAEKPPLALALLVPTAVVAWCSGSWRWRLGGPAIVAATFVVAVSPYLYYSGGTSYTPYASPRHYALGVVYEQQAVADFRAQSADQPRTGGDEESPFTPSGFVRQIKRAPGEIPASAAYYVVGRHTGLVVWAPLCLAAVSAGLWRLRRLDPVARACLLAIVGYVLFYVLLFPDNYYGGAHSLGNRYFLQAAPLVLGVLASLGWTARTSTIVSGVSLALSLVLLWPVHSQPRSAYLRIDRTGPIQELFPLESNQSGVAEFECASAHGILLDCETDVGE
jgi:4-amino-4-deoxy-L-arabinose transferase-like glycosyltransferase